MPEAWKGHFAFTYIRKIYNILDVFGVNCECKTGKWVRNSSNNEVEPPHFVWMRTWGSHHGAWWGLWVPGNNYLIWMDAWVNTFIRFSLVVFLYKFIDWRATCYIDARWMPGTVVLSAPSVHHTVNSSQKGTMYIVNHCPWAMHTRPKTALFISDCIVLVSLTYCML